MTKRKFQIVTDSACDMQQEYLKEHEIECIRLGFNMDNVNYEGESGEPITCEAFYAKLREGSMPTTYQVTGETAKTHIEPYLENGKDVLIIAFSSALSGTAGSFAVAARELSKKYPKRKIAVVDSLCASMGEGLFLDYVVKKADTGASLEETQKYAEELKGSIAHFFTVNDLFHLKRGGRVSTTTALIGSILKIKPIMHVDDGGHLTVIGKSVGRKKSLHTIVERFFEVADIGKDDPIFISHGDCMEDVEYVMGFIRAKYPDTEIRVGYVGSVIGAHAGPGVLAIFSKAKKR